MRLFAVAKDLAIHSGTYRLARSIRRRLNATERHQFETSIDLYQRMLPEGALCFDVGANIGEKSEALLEAGGRVVAFEPNPRVLPELRARCSRFDSWEEVAAAVGSTPGIARLYDRSWPGLSGLHEDWGGGPPTAVRFVPVVTLDAAIEIFGVPFYCKIDVEGWEREVLEGLSQAVPLLSFEFHLSEREVEKVLACVARLEFLGSGHFNLTPGDGSEFYFRDWLPLEDFASFFPGDLKESLGESPYGDIWVRQRGVTDR
jgi:FkbM family methyltransferase